MQICLFLYICHYFTESKYSGAQTFYPEEMDDSKVLAKSIHDELKRVVDDSNNRVIKPRNNLYLLKNCKMPSVLIECGFYQMKRKLNY